MSIVIESDDALAEQVLAMLREDYEAQQRERERDGCTHVSDLVFPRRAWLAQRQPKPLTDFDLLYFTAGRAHHEIIESMVNKKEFREVKVGYHDIIGTIDVLAGDGSPVEVKTTRTKEMYAPANLPDHFITQLGAYCAMLDPDEIEGKGQILLFYTGVKSKVGNIWRSIPRLRSYTVRFDNLEKVRSMLLRRKTALSGDTIPSTESCHSWLCRVCKWYLDGCDGWGSDLEYRVGRTWFASH